MRRLILIMVVAGAPLILFSQGQNSTKKYPSLFWEITGNGLKKPSYLFGTMHVSSKMVFNLSDSFYHAIKSTDAVALELNPEQWQEQMFRLQKSQLNLTRFSRPATNDFINEKSFQLQKYEDDIKRALSEEPTVVNNLLYRSYQSRADFEENTYLDLYIYQTGRKLGKQPAGVEDYMESERLMLEAYADMAKEKNKKSIDTDGQSMYEIEKKMQEAYRTGDLDLMDSLQRMTEVSQAFNEKFLYVRNEIQAHSIDTIIQKQSLFVGVGAAHLPGPRGVIELLRQKGYTLRPIFMRGRDAEEKEKIDKLKVPVNFQPVTSTDGMIEMKLPGQLFKREEAKTDSWQYADMNNGSYYMMTRVRTHGGILGVGEKAVLRKVDSLLYEFIPGKIVSKTAITKNGFHGFDITNKTRRGDVQRYQVLVTPYEILVFKMSGMDSYVQGQEAETFFNSIKINLATNDNWVQYQPEHGGFTVKLPQQPNVSVVKGNADRIDKWNFEALDKKTGNAYLVWRKSVYNFGFLEEDTFDLALMDESFQRSELVSKKLSRKMVNTGSRPFLEAKYLMKDGGYVQTRTFINGPHYYMLVARSNSKSADFTPFFSSFSFTPFKYPNAEKYVDSVLNIEVLTSVRPEIDTMLRSWIEKASADEGSSITGNYSYWPKSRTGVFKSDETGEAVVVNVESFPRYYYSRDTAKFWRDRMDEKNLLKDMVLKKKEFIQPAGTQGGYVLVLSDTNSSRNIMHKYLLKDDHLFRFSTITDGTGNASEFINQFFTSVQPIQKKLGPSIFENKLDLFFADYSSSDSLVKMRAHNAISNVYFGKAGANRIVEAINQLNLSDKNYFELKTKFINELGYIDDTTAQPGVIAVLKDLYTKTADTVTFQNPVLISLARLKNEAAYKVLKELLVQDPPIFENSYEYGRMFSHFTDTLPLARTLFPEILQLADVEDYRSRINSLLRQLVDSGYIQGKDYASYFNKLMFDATIQLKKQQVRDEKRMEQETKQDDDKPMVRGLYASTSAYGNSGSSINDYAVLLMPFYDQSQLVSKFFDKLLHSKDPDVQMNAALVMIRNNKKIPDTLLANLASKDDYRAKLLARLEKINRTDLFPAKYKSQEQITTSLLVNDKSLPQVAAVELVNKKLVDVKGKKGWIYMYKYKVKKEDDWKIGISGLQPENIKEVSSNKDMVKMTDRRLKGDEPVTDQFEQQIKQLVFAQHKSSRNFFTDKTQNVFRSPFGDIEDYEMEIGDY
ncbi:TraB/GumN family protein [Aridibaculum aurantiacum]|uniref:TraB/GumN family protein n=1 Tax=Aridibaculum aurantiacum TaxID=2810307 RepID=UPI001A976149|nr:TraB/GumN family protein [Aridibaculum aurantiacum]